VQTQLLLVTTPFSRDVVAPAPLTLAALAETIATAGEQTQAQITRERLEAEARTKCQAKKVQAAPQGLFAQTQGTLFS
jgi:hypothetical protein